jgi:hypothetical protein
MPREKWLKRRQDEGPPSEDIVREYFGPRGEKKDDRPRQGARPEGFGRQRIADAVPTLSISTEKVCFVILKAREFDVKDSATIPDEGSNPADDQMVEVLEDRGDDPVVWELAAFIGAMNEDEQIDLVTLTWLGRGDGSLQEWDELRAEAARAHNRHTVLYLLRTPLLPDYLEDGIAEFGRSCEDFEREHL